jgi:hypothetical protein
VLPERARRHYQQRGFVVGAPPGGVRADFLVEKAGRRRLVRLDDDPIGTYQIGALAAEAKRAGMLATVICPGSPEVVEACDQFGVEHLSPQGLGEEGPVIPARRPVVAPAPAAVAAAAASAPVSAAAVERPVAIPWWRWAIVAVIWLAAIVAWTMLLTRLV